MSQFGYEEGEICNRQFCKGVLELYPIENCSCHISPPCSACTTPAEFCPECDYEAKNDRIDFNHIVNVTPNGVYKHQELRTLDSTKIDYHSKSHTHFSMIKEGVYPEGTTSEELLKEIGEGTFGGRLEEFHNGKFKYVAYTD